MAKTLTAPPKDALEPAFTRGQVEWALWHQAPENAKRKPTRSFLIKIKHLLEFDRSEPVNPPAQSPAFSEEPTAGSGEHTLFSVFDAMMMETALGFLGIGFKRKEVVTHLRLRRAPLRKGWAPLLNQRLKQAPKELAGKSAPANDIGRVLLVAISLDDSPETLRQLKEAPAFYSSNKEIFEHLHDAPRLIVLDLAYSVQHLPLFLLKAPLRRRGRS